MLYIAVMTVDVTVVGEKVVIVVVVEDTGVLVRYDRYLETVVVAASLHLVYRGLRDLSQSVQSSHKVMRGTVTYLRLRLGRRVDLVVLNVLIKGDLPQSA